MEFRILGPLEIVVDGRTLPTPAPRLCALLAILLLRPHRVVSVDELIDGLWPDGAPQPANPTATVHTYVRRLRDIVGADVLQTRGRGYLLAAEPTDLVAFRSDLAAAAADPAQRVDHLRSALERWRGDPVSVEPTVAVGLNEERLTAFEQYYDARLSRGEHADVVPDLQTISAQEPLRERLTALLMIALYRCGRQSEALSTYDAFAERLVDEFGLDPTDDLRALRQSILTSTLDAPDSEWQQQNQLPLDIRNLVGRAELVREVVDLLTTTDGVRIVALSGTPGVGKTALAVRVAHEVTARFPDGQWFVRLRGASDQPRRADDVLVELLRASGVEPQAMPDDRDARAALFRSRLATRRVLLVLDDARDAAQVRHLLPGTPSSAVLITSRNPLDALAALDSGIPIRVPALTPQASKSLLQSMLDRSTDEEVEDLAELCGGLPLALRIAGAVGARGSVAHFVDRMRRRGALASLTIDDDTAVSSAFRTSYDLLDPEVQRGFRLLSLFPGQEFAPGAAEALIGPSYDEVLDRLEAASLLQPVGRGRYLMHDLVKEYAAQLAEPDLDAWISLCHWYVGTADAAMTALEPTGVRVPLPSYGERAVADPEAWLSAELGNVEAVAQRALEVGTGDVAWQLTDALRLYLAKNSLLSVWRALIQHGEAGARASGDLLGRGAMLHARGALARTGGSGDEAIECFEQAVELYRAGGFTLGEGALLCNLAVSHNAQGQLRRAAELFGRGLAVFRDCGEFERMPRGLNAQAMNHLHLGEFREAVTCATESLRLSSGVDQLVALINRAGAYKDTGQLDLAMADLKAAEPLVDNRLDRAQWGLALADVQNRSGDHEAARATANDVLEISREIGSTYETCVALQALAESYLYAGDVATGRTYLEEVEPLAMKSGYTTVLTEVRCHLAYCNFLDGQVDLAHSQATAVLAECEVIDYGIGQQRAHSLLARCCTALDRADEAAAHQGAADTFCERSGYVP
ncbi:AfsR/SARP family transcriptional regulator [Kribbella shirazensis]|uniref:DNA-binding SARP family transcriptional activator/tetratricopeptide (TPR) repeat protein n=1 Tax=Kribbella shirazensis TaxID=1105143 RepID=A0A7X5VBS7_9ACTN|nr:BTAD domain-containing putative transcriptional regulator [Kribbella shirazensis]NIK58227.1 DNA-binding SARP family transcriptional activator/tetratricopeptide (TPR) repeat protein [Kribbella shirazensis]